MRLSLIAWLAFVLPAASCKPSVGSSCEQGEARCLDARTELACQSGRFIQAPCNGPGGCALTAQGTSCDFSGNKTGDACSADEQGAARCANKDALISCRGGLYASLPCRGPMGCVNAAGRASCDTSIAEPSDACHDENSKACSSDGTQVLICKQYTMRRFYQCRGPNGCAHANGKLDCDTSIAMLGDACDPKLEGQAFSCTPDRSAILVCKGGAFVLDEPCKASQTCVALAGGTHCGKP